MKFWSGGFPPKSYDPSVRVPYLAVCSMFQNEAPYLKEWIEFHTLVGVERFYLYDNNSTDGGREVLDPYVEAGFVVVHDWPVYPQGQMPAYEHCLREHMYDATWMAFMDIDEFLFSPTKQPVAEMLSGYHAWPGVAVNGAIFGTSGHRRKPDGLVIENYVHRAAHWRLNSIRKMIVRPPLVLGCPRGNPHQFIYREGFAVDENGRHVTQYEPYCSFHLFRINHYWTKSEEEAKVRFGRPRSDTGVPREWGEFLDTVEPLNELRDEAILHYLPDLRACLSR